VEWRLTVLLKERRSFCWASPSAAADGARSTAGSPSGATTGATGSPGLPAHRFRSKETDRERVGRDGSPSAAIIDSQSVKTAEAGGPRGYDAGKKVNGRKRHALVDTDGRGLVLEPHPASTVTGVVDYANEGACQDRSQNDGLYRRPALAAA
jgi:hypothetical protein